MCSGQVDQGCRRQIAQAPPLRCSQHAVIRGAQVLDYRGAASPPFLPETRSRADRCLHVPSASAPRAKGAPHPHSYRRSVGSPRCEAPRPTTEMVRSQGLACTRRYRIARCRIRRVSRHPWVERTAGLFHLNWYVAATAQSPRCWETSYQLPGLSATLACRSFLPGTGRRYCPHERSRLPPRAQRKHATDQSTSPDRRTCEPPSWVAYQPSGGGPYVIARSSGEASLR